ncbi:transcriptional regulator [uncultured Porphyromonas sp.]|uniref:transcriptional regulator n=1 Tax=uncultured Porphyromonas sp. TaxID=159274 RepID=UPI0026051F61|nr:transcriptional regulator [uncultured Porphyromonas sp.]
MKEELKKNRVPQIWLTRGLGQSFGITKAYVYNRRQPNLDSIFKAMNLLNITPP